VSGPAATADVAKRVVAAGVGFVLHEAATQSLAEVELAGREEIVVVVGPEGGISDAELEELTVAGAHPVRLGSNVLRSSTAGVAALSAICARTRWT
jgi:16S rRNA (uracil1498-N3)-methyltransferase